MSSFPRVAPVARGRLGRAALRCVPLLVVALAARPFASGVSFTMRSYEGKVSSAVPGPAMHVRWMGGMMRFDGDPSAKSNSAGDPTAGGYTVVDMEARRVVVVMPPSKQYIEMKFDSSAAMVVQALAMQGVVSDVSVDGASLGSGEAVGGLSTKRYRLTTDFTYYDMKAPDKKYKSHVIEDYWVSDAMKDVINPTEQLARAMAGRGGFSSSPFGALGQSSFSKLVDRRAAEQAKLFRGMPVRTTTTSRQTDPSGDVEESVSTSEITDVKRVDLDPSLFRIPDGYTKFDMQNLTNMANQMKGALRGMGKSNGSTTGASTPADTTSMTDAAKQGAKEAAKESANDAARKAIGGFLRRKKP